MIAWFERELKESGVKIMLNTEVTLDSVRAMEAEEVVVATGASPKIPKLEGINQDHVLTAVEALTGSKPIGNNVVVIGGGQVGCELAIWLKNHGKNVTLVELAPKLMSGAGRPFESTYLQLADTLAFKNVEVLLNTSCKKIGKNTITVSRNNEDRVIDADTVVLSIGFNPDTDLYHEIDFELQKNVWCIGDAKQAANVLIAVRDSNAVGRII